MMLTPSGKAAVVYAAEDEAPHPRGDNEFWQESIAFGWYDMAKDAGGFIRFGHEPNLDHGNVTLWFTAHTPSWSFAESKEYPVRANDVSATRFSAGGIWHYEVEGGNTIWTMNDLEREVICRLVVSPYHAPLPLWPREFVGTSNQVSAEHFEVANAVRGFLEIKGERVEIDGVGHRDHSWGIRHWENFRCHRWINGVFGPDLAFCLSSVLMADGTMQSFGYVLRDGIVYHSTDIDIVTYMEIDGATHRGGWATLRLETGEVLKFEHEPLCLGSFGVKRDTYCFDSLGKVCCGDRIGFGVYEINENSRGGSERPANVVRALPSDGLFMRTACYPCR